MFYLLIYSILAAIWFKYELNRFPQKINQQIYEDMNSLVTLSLTLSKFQQQSKLQLKNTYFSKLLFIIFPILTILFSTYSFSIITIIFILIYLSLLDYNYYLTDIYYVSSIFMLSLIDLLFFNSLLIEIHLTTLVLTMLFFSLFIPLSQWVFKKIVLGSGDVVLFIALSPLFSLNEMLNLLLFSSLFGLLFSGIYWLIRKQKLQKLPFIPFISLAFLVCLH